MSSVQVLNADLSPLHKVSLRHAVRMIFRQVAEVHEADETLTQGDFIFPKIVRLVKYIATKWKYNHTPRWSKRGILIRDEYKCGYCGEEATTVDHVLPRAQGGKNTWQLTVAACQKCNQKKGARTPEEASMKLLIKPRIPK